MARQRQRRSSALYNAGDEDRVSNIGKKAPEEPFRSPWRRDLARLLHCPSFRRLQSKTQVFPGADSDFFRSRLTHSLEVAQIAKSIAIKLNATHVFFEDNHRKIIPDIVEFAGLAHDLGHPPFGHNGEEALHNRMADHGGFEGNAQTLHLLTRVEKKEIQSEPGEEITPFDRFGNDMRLGLNLSYRSLASILKYDNCIPEQSIEKQKGYYACDRDVVDAIKHSVIGDRKHKGEFKTIECAIMDVADDIAYSTYDLEDAFKAGLLTPIDLFSLPPDVAERVVKTIRKRLKKYSPTENFTHRDLNEYLFLIFAELFNVSDDERAFLRNPAVSSEMRKLHQALAVTKLSKKLADDGYQRVEFTSKLVQKFMDGILVEPNEQCPPMTTVKLDIETFKMVEVLKNITYEAVIMAPRMRVVEYRGYDVICAIFDALASNDPKETRAGKMLLPDDYRELYDLADAKQKKRVVCDFIAGMTDRYAWQFYNRLCGSDPMTIYKPV